MPHKLEQIVAPWRSSSDYLSPSGGIFVCHWPARGRLSYLHELYSPCVRADTDLVSKHFEFQVPTAYFTLLREHNGARFFLGTVSLSGVVSGDPRSLNLDEAQAGSLVEGLEIFRAMFPNRWDAGWRKVGGITVNQQWSVEINRGGMIAVVAGAREVFFSDVWAFLLHVTGLLASSFRSDGTQVDSWDDINRRLERAFA